MFHVLIEVSVVTDDLSATARSKNSQYGTHNHALHTKG